MSTLSDGLKEKGKGTKGPFDVVFAGTMGKYSLEKVEKGKAIKGPKMSSCLEPSSRNHDGPAFIRISYMQTYVTGSNIKYVYYAKLKGKEYFGSTLPVLARRMGIGYDALKEAWSRGVIDTPEGVASLYGGRK